MEIFIAQLYFEHHVEMKEISGSWSNTMKGTIKDSLQLLHSLREKGYCITFLGIIKTNLWLCARETGPGFSLREFLVEMQNNSW